MTIPAAVRRAFAGPFLISVLLIEGAGLAAAAGDSCRDEVGAERAASLVAQCVEVSPATHPPCNAANACDSIVSEIVRGCRLLDDGSAPSFCKRYRGK